MRRLRHGVAIVSVLLVAVLAWWPDPLPWDGPTAVCETLGPVKIRYVCEEPEPTFSPLWPPWER